MEILFALTHAVMLICLFGILYISISDRVTDNKEKTTAFYSVREKITKARKISLLSLYRSATAILMLFL